MLAAALQDGVDVAAWFAALSHEQVRRELRLPLALAAAGLLELMVDLSRRSGTRPVVAVKVSLAVLSPPSGEFVYVLCATESLVLRAAFESLPGVAETRFWDNYDTPESVSTREWAPPCRVW